MVKMISVDSSNIEAIGYNTDTSELYVNFILDRGYIYKGVPEKVFKQFLDADSKGRFLNQEIKDVYPYSQLKTED